jgi:starch phosphorylase
MESPVNCPPSDSTEALKLSITNHLRFTLGAYVSSAIRERLVCSHLPGGSGPRHGARHEVTRVAPQSQGVSRVYIISRWSISWAVCWRTTCAIPVSTTHKEALCLNSGKDLDTLLAKEPDMGLGNGGLGRLAACFLDSLSTLNLPAIGYGIHYEFGLFRQEFVNGKQVEHPDAWMRDGSPGRSRVHPTARKFIFMAARCKNSTIWGILTTSGWIRSACWACHGISRSSAMIRNTVNVLRLWEAQADEEFNFQIFNEGSYTTLCARRRWLKPCRRCCTRMTPRSRGKELRLVQQYFFVACSLADIVRRFKNGYNASLERVSLQSRHSAQRHASGGRHP